MVVAVRTGSPPAVMRVAGCLFGRAQARPAPARAFVGCRHARKGRRAGGGWAREARLQRRKGRSGKGARAWRHAAGCCCAGRARRRVIAMCLYMCAGVGTGCRGGAGAPLCPEGKEVWAGWGHARAAAAAARAALCGVRARTASAAPRRAWWSRVCFDPARAQCIHGIARGAASAQGLAQGVA
ncbi:MAG: hypothetical protein J3K34DRAFT_435229 [Monoraphidium minutum]|nr:MAG: hypothetical protein J3K34DRAFT_435229 [Monoraphidium minutum]